MPPKLSAALAALGIEAGTGEFSAVETLLGGSFSGWPGSARAQSQGSIPAPGSSADRFSAA
jgi:hypothetical protein